MSNDEKYLQYEGYYNRFGDTIRPALVRYREGYYEDQEYVGYRFFIDNQMSDEYTLANKTINDKPYSIALLSNRRSEIKDVLLPQRFNPLSEDSWIHLFEDALMLRQNGDPLAHALMTIAFDKFNWQINVIKNAISMLGDNRSDIITDMVVCLSWALSPNKINQIKQLSPKCQAIFPICLEEAAELYSIDYANLNVHTLADDIISVHRQQSEKKHSGFLRFIDWMDDEQVLISLQEICDYFPYLDERERNLAIKRFFYDVKRGVFTYNDEAVGIFTSQNYLYYSQYRYIFESWPNLRNVSSDFVLDCIKTYISSNQQSLQEYNGILDWAMRKSMELHRPVKIRFNDWLSSCEGGILLNQKFKGFAEFEIKYEIDDLLFEDDSLRRNIETLRDRHSRRCSHKETRIYTNPETGEAIIDEKTGKPKTYVETIWEDRWRISGDNDSDVSHHKSYIDIFVNWEKRPATETDKLVFTPEMIDTTIIRGNVEQYLESRFCTTTPYISLRNSDEVVKLFMYEVTMKATFNESSTLGEDPGVKYEVVKDSITERLSELFGDSLECDYDYSKLRLALTDTLYSSLYTKENNCFVKSEKTYQGRMRIYCAPALSERPTLLTKRKCAICQSDMCFVTCIKKSPKWKEYKLIHLLEILGYNVLEETEAGFIPNPVYNQFVIQINKAVRFYKRLVCRECGHILFPVRFNPNNPQNIEYNRTQCLSPSCPQHRKEVYLSFCHDCKKGLIDSRDSKQCPNGLYICPDCNSCCSNAFFQEMVDRRHRLGLPIPKSWSKNIGQGHADRGMIFCHVCGTQKVDVRSDSGKLIGRCPICEPLPPPEEMEPLDQAPY